MTSKDKRELGLKEDAPLRQDDLPAGSQAPAKSSAAPTPQKPRRVVHARAGWVKPAG
jgi:hypothetical protein